MTLADRVAAALATVAGAHCAAVLAAQGATTAAVVVAGAGVAIAASQVLDWTRSRRRPAWRLERRSDGVLQVRVGAGPAVPAVIGGGTRRLGPSVFLEVRCATGRRTAQYRRWLTPLDVPSVVLRRWSVVLPSSGRAACS